MSAAKTRPGSRRNLPRLSYNSYYRTYRQARPTPAECHLLDPDWDDDGLDLIEAILAGREITPDASIYDRHPSHGANQAKGWEATEQYAAHANRLNADYLNDEAVMRRRAQRDAEKAAWAEIEAERHARTERTRLEREAVEAAARQRRQEQQEQQERNRSRLTYLEEGAAILASRWECEQCKIKAIITHAGEGIYRFSCFGCGRQSLAAHEKLMGRL